MERKIQWYQLRARDKKVKSLNVVGAVSLNIKQIVAVRRDIMYDFSVVF